jgi:hypothetical protein
MGGVLLNLNDEHGIREAFNKLSEIAKEISEESAIESILICEMIDNGVETVLGVVKDPVFGPTVMFGLGGIFIEILKDVTFRVAPFDVKEAHMMINEIRGRAILDGVRGAPPVDVDALAEALSQLSLFAAANIDNVDSIDVNPFIVLPRGAKIVDALIIASD